MSEGREHFADECAEAWAAYVSAQASRIRLAPGELARALLHAAISGFCRRARRAADEADSAAVAAARLCCLLQLALRAGTYDPTVTVDEQEVWGALLEALPAGWAEALEEATVTRGLEDTGWKPKKQNEARIINLSSPRKQGIWRAKPFSGV